MASPSGEFTKIWPENPTQYQAISNRLDELKVQHYILPERSSLPLRIVIRGLDIDTPTEDIEQALKELGYTPSKTSQMTSFKTGRPMPLFQVHLTDNEDNKKIFSLTSLLYYSINVEKYNPPKRTLICYRCQYYHHSSSSCKMNARCCRCNGAHETKNCDKGAEKLPQEALKCVNCGGNHVTSYRGCPKLPENIRKRRELEQRAKENPKFTATRVSPNVSYADLAKSTLPHFSASSPPVSTPTPSATPLGDLSGLAELKNILSSIAAEFGVQNFNELVQIYKACLIKIKQTNNPMEKLSILMEVLDIQSSAP